MIKIQSLSDLQNEWKNPYIQWYAAGMPSFNTYDISPYKQIKLKFKTMEDRDEFAKLMEVTLTEKTNVIWFPSKDREKNNMSRIVEE